MKSSKQKQTPKIQCPTCAGFGKVDLSGVLLETFSAIQKLHNKGKVVTSATLFKQMGGKVSVTALCNRLDDLANVGILTREKAGKWFVYTPNKN